MVTNTEYRKTIKDVPIKGKYVFLRVGLDVPLDPNKELSDPERVTDDTRIRDILPTVRYGVKNNAKFVLAAGWCGRPEGEDPDFSMAPVAKRLEKILVDEGLIKPGDVLFTPNCYEDKKPRSVYKHQDEVKKTVAALKPGQIAFLENVRYDGEAKLKKREQHLEFARFFASLVGKGAVYVNEAETQNHRPEATIITTPIEIAKNGGEVVYGLQYANVLENIGSLRQKLEECERGSFVFGLCGKKIESDPGIISKITVARDLIDKMREGDTIVTGGAVTYTFILAQHYTHRIEENYREVNTIVKKYDQMIMDQTKDLKDEDKIKGIIERLQKQKSEELKSLLSITNEEIKELIGDSYIRWGQEGEQIVFAYDVMTKAKARGVRVFIAYDHTIANAGPDKRGMLPESVEVKPYKNLTGIPQGWLGVAPGSRTLDEIVSIIEDAGIYLQSGPYSIEDSRVEEISRTDKRIFEAARKCKKRGGVSIAAGGDTVARVNAFIEKENKNKTKDEKIKPKDYFSTITSAGGATLELINGDSVGRDAVEEAQKFKK